MILNTILKYKRCFFIFLGYKFGLSAFMIMCFYLFPAKANHWNYIYNPETNIDPLSVFYNWDGQHILNIAENGYEENISDKTAQWPLLPLSIKIFSLVKGAEKSVALALIFIINILFFCYFLAFYENIYDEKTAIGGLILFLSFPSAFYLNVIYSEILFCLICLMLLYHFYVGKRLWFIPFAFLLPLSRAMGPFVLLAIGIVEGYNIITKENKKKRLTRLFILTVSSCTGLLGYFLIYKYYTGDFFASIKAQKAFVFQFSLLNIVNPIHFILLIFSIPEGINSLNRSFISITTIWFFILHAIFLVYRKENPFVLILCFIIVGYVSAAMGEGGLYFRYILVAILFIAPVMARQMKKISPNLILISSVIGFSLQLIFAAMFSLNLWVS